MIYSISIYLYKFILFTLYVYIMAYYRNLNTLIIARCRESSKWKRKWPATIYYIDYIALGHPIWATRRIHSHATEPGGVSNGAKMEV